MVPWVRKAQRGSPAHPWGETSAGSTGPGLLLQELREAAPGIGNVLEVRLGDPGAVVPWAESASIENRFLGGLGVRVEDSGAAATVPFTHHTLESGSLDS